MRYEEARQLAQQRADEAALANPEYARKGGCDYGVWKNAIDGFTVQRLPLPGNRTGTELRCEVVTPSLLAQNPGRTDTPGYILWDDKNGDPPRDATTGAFLTSGALGILTPENVYLTSYAKWVGGDRTLSELKVGQCIRGVRFALSGERGEYSVWRVR